MATPWAQEVLQGNAKKRLQHDPVGIALSTILFRLGKHPFAHR
jgi:hypothetical protein